MKTKNEVNEVDVREDRKEQFSLLRPKESIAVRLEKYKKMSTGGGANNLHIRNPDPDYHYRFEAVQVNGETVPGIEAHLAEMGVEAVGEEEALRVGAPGSKVGGLLLCKRHKSFVDEEYKKQLRLQREVLAEIPQYAKSEDNPNKIKFEKRSSDSISYFPED